MQWKNLVKQLFDLLLKVGEIAVLLPDLHLCLLQRLQQVFYHSHLLLRRHLQLLELLCSSSFRLQLSARKGGKDRADGMCIVPTGQMCTWARVASHRRCRRLRCFKLQVVPGCKAVHSRALLPTTLFLLTFPEYLQPPSSSHLSSALSISYSSVLLELLDKSPWCWKQCLFEPHILTQDYLQHRFFSMALLGSKVATMYKMEWRKEMFST